MGHRTSSPETCWSLFMLALAMSVHHSQGLTTALSSLATFSRHLLKKAQKSAMFSVFSCSVSVTARGIYLFSNGLYALASVKCNDVPAPLNFSVQKKYLSFKKCYPFLHIFIAAFIFCSLVLKMKEGLSGFPDRSLILYIKRLSFLSQCFLNVTTTSKFSPLGWISWCTFCFWFAIHFWSSSWVASSTFSQSSSFCKDDSTKADCSSANPRPRVLCNWAQILVIQHSHSLKSWLTDSFFRAI